MLLLVDLLRVLFIDLVVLLYSQHVRSGSNNPACARGRALPTVGVASYRTPAARIPVTYQTCILETPSMKRSVQNLAFSRFSPNQAIPWTFEHLSAKDYCTRLKSEYERDVKKWMCNCSRLVLAVAGARRVAFVRKR